MINERFIKSGKAFGVNIYEIEGFADAMLSDELYVCHHLAECRYTKEELIAAGHYYNVTADELMFVRDSVHRANSALHIGCRMTDERRLKISKNNGSRLASTKEKISNALKGKPGRKKTAEEKSKNSKANKLLKTAMANKYHSYKHDGGKLSWNEFQKANGALNH